MDDVSRRGFLGKAGSATAAAGLAASPALARAQTTPQATPTPTLPQTGEPLVADGNAGAPSLRFVFFQAAEGAFVSAAVDRLIPGDDLAPGAAELGVPEFIDRQLAGPYGVGHRMYLEGPFANGTPEQGYQLPYTPAELYRLALQRILPAVEQRYGQAFDTLALVTQDEILRALEHNRFDMPEMPSAVFFETLLANTIEGYFADPIYGGNRNMAAWRMLGFPGAYAQYVQFVDNHGMVFDRAPMSIAEAVIAHDHH